MTPRRLEALQAHAKASGPEAEIARKILAKQEGVVVRPVNWGDYSPRTYTPWYPEVADFTK